MRYFGFSDVDDPKFHELRRAYNKAGDALYEHFMQNLKVY
jgi:hypothetical protein